MTRPAQTQRRRQYRRNAQVLAAYAELRAQGLLHKQIARRLGFTTDALDYHLQLGRAAGDRRAAPLNDHAARAAAVAELTEQGRSLAAIADELGLHERTVGRIRARLRYAHESQGVVA